MTEQIKIKHEEVNVGNGTVTESETLVHTTGHVKSLIDNALTGIVNFISKPWYKILSVLTLCNKFTVLVLSVFFAAGYLPAIKLLGNSQTLYQLLDVSLFQVMVLTVIALYSFGVKRILSKLALIVLILVVLYQLNEMREMMADFLGGNNTQFTNNAIQMAFKSMRYGLYLWLVSFMCLVLLSVLPMYQSNKKLWPALVDIVNTKPTHTLDVKAFTGKVNANVQLVVQKANNSIEQISTDGNKVQLDNLRSLSNKKKALMVTSTVMIFLVVAILFSGNSAPSARDVEKIIAAEMQDESGFLSTELSAINLKDCEEVSGRELPTFTCTVEGVITADLGALGSVLGGNTEKSETFSLEYIFVKGESGWYGH